MAVWVHIFNFVRKQSQADFCEFQASQGAYNDCLNKGREGTKIHVVLDMFLSLLAGGGSRQDAVVGALETDLKVH